jgi:hypothetical protein
VRVPARQGILSFEAFEILLKIDIEHVHIIDVDQVVQVDQLIELLLISLLRCLLMSATATEFFPMNCGPH